MLNWKKISVSSMAMLKSPIITRRFSKLVSLCNNCAYCYNIYICLYECDYIPYRRSLLSQYILYIYPCIYTCYFIFVLWHHALCSYLGQGAEVPRLRVVMDIDNCMVSVYCHL